ncbi:hypothetical protein EJB05_34474, partial [Eragrostis curvula]
MFKYGFTDVVSGNDLMISLPVHIEQFHDSFFMIPVGFVSHEEDAAQENWNAPYTDGERQESLSLSMDAHLNDGS